MRPVVAATTPHPRCVRPALAAPGDNREQAPAECCSEPDSHTQIGSKRSARKAISTNNAREQRIFQRDRECRLVLRRETPRMPSITTISATTEAASTRRDWPLTANQARSATSRSTR